MSGDKNNSTACHNLTFQDRKKRSSYGRIRQVMAGSQPKKTRKKRQVMAGSSSYARQVMAGGTEGRFLKRYPPIRTTLKISVDKNNVGCSTLFLSPDTIVLVYAINSASFDIY